MSRISSARVLTTALVLSFITASSALADGAKLRGFATAGATMGDSDTPLENITNKANFENDSKVGLNVSGDLGDKWNVAAQLVSSNKDNYKPTMDWFFATYRPTNNVSVKAGRLVVPFWLLSEQVDVGLTYPWTRPPREVYYLGDPLKSFAGAAVTYNYQVMGMDLSLDVFFGQSAFDWSIGSGVSGRKYYGNMTNAKGAILTASNDWLTLRGSFSAATLDIRAQSMNDIGTPLSTLFGSVNGALGTSAGVYLNNNYATVDKQLSVGDGYFLSFGEKIEWKNFFSLAEYATRRFDGASIHRIDGAYGTVGYKLPCKFIPHFTYAWMGNVEFNHPNNGATADPYNYAIAYKLPKGSQTSLIAGLNYQANPSTVLKLEYQYTKSADGMGLFSPNYTGSALASYPSIQNQTFTDNIINASVNVVF